VNKERRTVEEPCTIILDHGANPPTFWVVKSKRKLIAVLDDGSVLDASFEGQLWEGASTINNRQLARDIAMRFGHGIDIGSEWVDVTGLFRLKVRDLLRDGRAMLEVLERPSAHGWTIGLEIMKPIKELQADYQEVPKPKQEVRDEG
jgi:hypothetical protein